VEDRRTKARLPGERGPTELAKVEADGQACREADQRRRHRCRLRGQRRYGAILWVSPSQYGKGGARAQGAIVRTGRAMIEQGTSLTRRELLRLARSRGSWWCGLPRPKPHHRPRRPSGGRSAAAAPRGQSALREGRDGQPAPRPRRFSPRSPKGSGRWPSSSAARIRVCHPSFSSIRASAISS